ncbi:hypothetical protein FOL47_002754 [Perkinsus chesapeaki]|uniref:Uncharacterized protein n=1 Tax=Perkinsus chesapeaki TaxID=330153 RepID=A0A7J6N2B0_PERCH|nr:hypothetical protein FOL47_002754 [Perkinsus chesapeaki]
MSPRWCMVPIYWLIYLLTVGGHPNQFDSTLHSAWTGPGLEFRLDVVTYLDKSRRRRASIIITYPPQLNRGRDRFDAALEPTAKPGNFNLRWAPNELRRARLTLSGSGLYRGNPATIILDKLTFTGEVHEPVRLTISRTMTITAYPRNDPNSLPPFRSS